MKVLSKEQIEAIKAQTQLNKSEGRIVHYEESDKYQPIHFVGASTVATKRGIVNYTPKGSFKDKGRQITETPKAPSDTSITQLHIGQKVDRHGYPCGTRKSETTNQIIKKKGKTVKYAHKLHNLESKDQKAMNKVNKQ